MGRVPVGRPVETARGRRSSTTTVAPAAGAPCATDDAAFVGGGALASAEALPVDGTAGLLAALALTGVAHLSRGKPGDAALALVAAAAGTPPAGVWGRAEARAPAGLGCSACAMCDDPEGGGLISMPHQRVSWRWWPPAPLVYTPTTTLPSDR